MQSDNKIFDDLTKLASSAMGSMLDMKKEIDARFKENVERMVGGGLKLVSREEFEVVKAMIAKARAEQEKLEKKIDALEKKLAAGKATKKKK